MNDKEHLISASTDSSPSYGAISHDVIKDPRHHQRSPASDVIEDGDSHQRAQKEYPNVQNGTQEAHISQAPRSRLCGFVCIEIPAFLYFVSFMNASPLLQYYLTYRIGQELGTPNTTSTCSGGQDSNNESALENRIQDRVASYTMITSFLTFFPAVLPALFMGSLSDRFGRKVTVYLVCLGTAARMTVYALVFHYSWPIEYLYIGCVLEGLTGSFGSFIMSAFAIAADVTKEGGQRRSFRIAVTEAANMLGSSTGSIMAGYWVTALGFVSPMLFSIGLQVVVILFVLIFIPDTAVRPRQTTPVGWSILKRSCQVFLRHGRRCFLLTGLLTFSLALFTLVGNTMVILLYLLNLPFCWTEIHISIYSGATMLVSWVSVLSLTSSLGTRVADDTLALVGALSGMVSFIFQGSSKSDLFTYIAAGTGLLSNLTWPMLRTLMSKKVDSQEQGAVFAGIAVVEMLSSAVTGIVAPTIYKLSLRYLHGLTFYCFAAVDVFVAVCIISLIVGRKTGGAKKAASSI